MNTFFKRWIATAVSIALVANPALAAAPPAQLKQQLAVSAQSLAPTAAQPPATAIVLAADAQAGIKQAANGTAVIDIATPTAKGVSRNQFAEFNVDQSGVIFNNSANPVLTQLGGWSDGNRRLAGGEAKVILSEVDGTQRSSLLGQVEIAGKSAAFVLANPNGITCSGCGFINTPRVSLVTGSVVTGDKGLGFDVSGGDIVIEGSGLNASAIDRFDIITRSAQINATIYAKELNFYTGSNHFDYDSSTLTAINSTAANVHFALDTALLGGMYANSIRLIGTEKGVGVNTQGLVQAVTDLELTADGDIRVKDAVVGNNLQLASTSGDIAVETRLYGKQVNLAGDTIVNKGLLAAEKSLTLKGRSLDQQGDLYAGLATSGTLANSGTLTAAFSEAIINEGTIFVASDLQLSVPSLSNNHLLVLQSAQTFVGVDALHNQGSLQFNSQVDVTLTADSIDNNNGEISLTGQGALGVIAQGHINNRGGAISAAQGLHIKTAAIGNNEGLISASKLELSSDDINNAQGILQSNQLALSANVLTNQRGEIYSLGKDSVNISLTGHLDNTQGRIYSNANSANVVAGQLVNREGSLVFKATDLQISLQQDFNNQYGLFQSGNTHFSTQNFSNDNGELYTGKFALTAKNIANNGGFLQTNSAVISAESYLSDGGVLLAKDSAGSGLNLSLAQQLNNTEKAVIRSLGGNLHINASTINNAGSAIMLAGNGKLSLESASFINQGGTLTADNQLQLKTTHFANASGALRAGSVDLTAESIDNTAAIIQSKQHNLNIAAAEFNSSGGIVVSAGDAALILTHNFNNNQGVLRSEGLLQLSAAQVDNTLGEIDSQTLAMQIQSLNNYTGSLTAGEIYLNLPQLDNRHGVIASTRVDGGGLQLTVSGALDNSAGTLLSQGQYLQLNADQLNNAQGKIISQTNSLTVTSKDINNLEGLIQAAADIGINAQNLNNNSGTLLAGNNLQLLNIALNNRQGLVLAKGTADNSLALSGQVNNYQGRLETLAHNLTFENLVLNNQQGILNHVGEGTFSLKSSGTFNNRAGVVQTDGNLLVNAAEAIDNRAGLLSGQRVEVSAAALIDNSEKGTIEGENLVLSAAHINNAAGYLLANGTQASSITFNTSTAIDNRAGELRSSASDWLLNLDLFDNAGGTVAHLGSGVLTVISARELNNSGIISSKANLLVNAKGVVNSGQLLADKNFTLNSGEDIRNSDTGLLKAGEVLHIAAADVDLHNRGDINSGTGLKVFLGQGDFNNSGNFISSANNAELALGTLNNAGVFAHNGAGTVSIKAKAFVNSNQFQAIRDSVAITAVDFANSGMLSAHQLRADGINSGSNSQRIEADQFTLSGNVFSNSGTLVAIGTEDSLDLLLRDFTNSGTVSSNSLNQSFHGNLINTGTIEHAGSGKLLLGAKGAVNDTGKIATAGTAYLLNQLAGTGELFAKLGIVIEGVEFSNAARLYTQGDIKITSELRNSGKMLADGKFSLQTSGAVNNDDGTLQGGDLTLSSNSLSNQAGLITATGPGLGSIHSATTINNQRGTIASGNREFNLSAGGAIENSEGFIIQKNADEQTPGLLTITAGSQLNNTLGTLIAEGKLAIDAGHFLLNRQAKNLAADSLTLKAVEVDNTQGKIALSGSDDSSITAQTLTNTGGEISANSDKLTLALTGIFSNEKGQLKHAGGKDLNITAATITTDVESKLLSNGNLALNLNSDLNNSGEIGAQLNNIIKAQNLINSGIIRSAEGLVDLQLKNFNLTNSGALSSHHQLKIDAHKISNSGSVGAQNSIDISVTGFDGVGQIISNDSLTLTLIDSLVLQAGESLIAPKSLSITTQGGFDNSGLLSATNDIHLTGNYLNNYRTGKITAGVGAGSSFTISGDILNQGSISTQQDLAIRAYNFTNDMDAIVVTGGKLSFDLQSAQPARFINRNVIYAVGDLSLQNAAFIDNTSEAVLLSGGAMELQASDMLSNIEGRIEAKGSMTLRVDKAILNQSTMPVLVAATLPVEREASGIYNGSNNGSVFDVTVIETTTKTERFSNLEDIKPAKILAGGDLNLLGSETQITNKFGEIFAGANLVVDGRSLLNEAMVEKTEVSVNRSLEIHPGDCPDFIADNVTNCTPLMTYDRGTTVTSSYQHLFGSFRAGGDISGKLTKDFRNISNVSGIDKLPDWDQGNYKNDAPQSANAILKDGAEIDRANSENTSLNQIAGNAANAAGGTREANGNINGNNASASNGSEGGIGGAANSNKTLAALTLAPGSDPNAAIQEQLRDLSELLGKADPVVGATLTVPVVSFSVLPINFNLNNLSGLYVIAQSPSSHYLIETRPEFTSFERFIGSDYLLAALGYDPEQTLKRLGDAFFETQLIKDTLIAEASTRYLDGETNDYDQMQRLMDNAVEANKNLQLTLGVELTPQQAAALTQDMIWMVQKKVNGEKVLVPQLYLTSVSQDKLNASKATIGAGGSVNLAATGDFLNQTSISGGGDLKLSTKGNFAQNGMVVARGKIDLIADQVLANTGLVKGTAINIAAQDSLTNSGKILAETDLSLTAKGDIRNQQGLLSGSDVSLQSTQGSIINRTEYSQVTRVDRQGRTQVNTKVGSASTIISRNSLSLDAGKNLDLQGSQFAAANDISLVAGEDVLLNAIENKNAGDSSSRKHTVKNSSTQFQVVDIKAGGDLSLAAGRDLVAQGSQLSAAGDVGIAAQRDLNLTATANTYRNEDLASRKKQIDSSTTHTLVDIKSDGDTRIQAGQDANLTGVAIAAEGDVALSAKRDTNVSAVVDSDYHYDSITKKKSFGRSKTTTNETLAETLVGGTIASGGDLLINAHKNSEGQVIGDQSGKVNLAGVSLSAKKDMAIAADEDINITGMHYETLDYHQTKKSGALGLSKKDKGAVQNDSHLQNAEVQAGGNAHILSGAGLNLAAANVVVNGNIDLQAVDNLLVTAGEAVSNSKEWNNKSRIFSGGDLYNKKEHKAGETVTAAQASNIKADGTVTAKAGTGQVIGSNISGDQGVTLVSDAGDVDILSAKTTTQAYRQDKSLSVGVGDLGKAISRPDQLVKNQDGRATVKLADAQYDSVENRSNAVSMQGSTLASQQDVTVIASAGKVNVQGSTLIADSDNNQAGNLGLAGATGVNINEAIHSYESETKEIHGSAELSAVVQHQAVEVVKAAIAVDKAKDQLEKAKKDYKAYERNLDQLQSQLGQLESDYANKVPGIAYDDLLELREIIRDSKDDKEWYQAGIALAAVNLTSSITALVQQTAAVAASAGTYGFNAGLQLDIDATKSNAKQNSTTAQASNLSGHNILIQTGTANHDGTLNRAGTTTNIQGSHLAAGNQIAIQTGELNLLNSKNTTEQKNETEHGQVTAQMTVYGAAGGVSVSGSFDRSKDSNTTTTVNNTTLNADNISLDTTGDTNLRGANVHADSELLANVGGNLNVESQQNRSRSKNNSVGISGGFSLGGQADEGTSATAKTSRVGGNAFTNNLQGTGNIGSNNGINGGINASNGMSTTRETVLTSLTSGGTAAIKVKGNTQITGALIATIDGEDTNNLNFDTGSLTFTDLRNTHIGNQTSTGFSTHLGVGNQSGTADKNAVNTATTSDGDPLRVQTSNLTYDTSQSNSASKTLATLGHGNITVGGVQLERNGELTAAGKTAPSLIALNRDASTTEKSLWNSEQSQAVDATLDHRLLTEEGQSQIKEDAKRSAIGAESIINLAEQSVSFLGNGEGETSLRQHMLDTQDYFTATKNFANNPDNAKYIEVINSGTGTPEQKDAAYTALANSIAVQMDVDPVKAMTLVQDHYNLNTQNYEGTALQQQIQGAYAADKNNNQGLIFVVDDNIASTSDAVNILGHETSHHIDANRDLNLVKTQAYQDNRENYSDIMGAATVDYLNFNFSSNNYDLLGAANAHTGSTVNSAAVRQNNATFNALDQHQVDYRQLAIPEIQYISDGERVERFADYIKSSTGEELTTKEAKARLLQGAAGLMDGKWQERYGTDAKVMDFLTSEVAQDIKAVTSNPSAAREIPEAILDPRLLNSDLAYVDPKTGEKRLVFNLKEGEYADERKGVIEFMSNPTLGSVDELGVAKTDQQRRSDFWIGHTRGQGAAIDHPVDMTVEAVASAANGLWNFVSSPIDTTQTAWQDFKEADAYGRLLGFQGRDQDLGYIEGYSQGAMAVSVVAAPAMEAIGGSLLQGALVRANGGMVEITADANGQVNPVIFRAPAQDIAENDSTSHRLIVRYEPPGEYDFYNMLQSSATLSYDKLLNRVESLDVTTGISQSIFYSGRGARATAEAYAVDNNMFTLEQTPGGKWLDELKLFENTVPGVDGEGALTLWSRISERYADQSKGDITAFINNPRPASIFLTKELPMLLQNDEVKQIIIKTTNGNSNIVRKGESVEKAKEIIEELKNE